MNPRLPFIEKLRSAWRTQDSLLCVGLDPDAQRYPASLANNSDRVFEFCRAIIDATAPHCCAFKPQIAYFAAQSAEGALQRLCAHIRSQLPDHLLILDAKRGDIGVTAKQYAIEAYERYDADVVTVNPYMGFDSIEPFLQWADRGVFLLCRTSNPGGQDVQGLQVDGHELLYERIARLSGGAWNRNEQLGLVVGATWPSELARVRELAPDIPLLIPGIGAQGGDIHAAVRAGRTADGSGMVINSSRAILYAGSGPDYAAQAAKVAQATNLDINTARVVR
jgi:orotidine-5'-phosphate decarboxylase